VSVTSTFPLSFLRRRRTLTSMTPRRIQKIRKALGLSQEDFAHILWVTWSTVNRWEIGNASPTGMLSSVGTSVRKSPRLVPTAHSTKRHTGRACLVPSQRQSLERNAFLVGIARGAPLANRHLPQIATLRIPDTISRGVGLQRRCRRESLFEPTLDPREPASSCPCAVRWPRLAG
jgi:DNA-binding transcriptional regulator YiaG